jgi:hypothetical protein
LRKSILAVIIMVSLLAGFAGGFWTSHYKYIIAPQKEAQETAQKQQEALDKMVRHGEAVTIKPEKITIKVEKGGGDIGKTITLGTTEYTSIQVGMGFVGKPGQKTDLTTCFKSGDSVDALVIKDQATALHREFRAGEEAPQPTQVQAGGPPVQGQPVQGQQQR